MKAFLTIVLAAASMPALAGGTQSATIAAGEVGDLPVVPRLICRRINRVESLRVVYGSRARICHTAAQWRSMHDGSVDDAMDAMGPMSHGMNRPKDGFTNRHGVR